MVEGENMTFKKNGSDAVYDPAPNRSNLGFRWIGDVARLFGFNILKPERQPPNPYAEYRSKRPQQKTKKHRNMMLVSKRVRRKHRRAA